MSNQYKTLIDILRERNECALIALCELKSQQNTIEKLKSVFFMATQHHDDVSAIRLFEYLMSAMKDNALAGFLTFNEHGRQELMQDVLWHHTEMSAKYQRCLEALLVEQTAMVRDLYPLLPIHRIGYDNARTVSGYGEVGNTELTLQDTKVAMLSIMVRAWKDTKDDALAEQLFLWMFSVETLARHGGKLSDKNISKKTVQNHVDVVSIRRLMCSAQLFTRLDTEWQEHAQAFHTAQRLRLEKLKANKNYTEDYTSCKAYEGSAENVRNEWNTLSTTMIRILTSAIGRNQDAKGALIEIPIRMALQGCSDGLYAYVTERARFYAQYDIAVRNLIQSLTPIITPDICIGYADDNTALSIFATLLCESKCSRSNFDREVYRSRHTQACAMINEWKEKFPNYGVSFQWSVVNQHDTTDTLEKFYYYL